MRVAVTGSTGFVGTALCRRLREEGHEVVGLARASSHGDTRDRLVRLGVTLVDGDLDDRPALRRLCEGADLVVHGAAIIGYRRRLWGAMQRVNVLGTRHVCAAALEAGVGRLVHVSSIAAFGATKDPRVLDERAGWMGDELDAAYFDTKHGAEVEVDHAIGQGLDATFVNPAAIYGASEAVSNSSNVIRDILTTRFPYVPRGGINVVPLDTVVEGIVSAAARGATGRRYLLVGENLTLADLFRRVGAAAGVEIAVREVPWVPWGLVRLALDLVEPFVPDSVWFPPDMLSVVGRYMWFDGSRARDELGVVASDLDACLRETVDQLRRDGRVPR